jgi:hypothetical protein
VTSATAPLRGPLRKRKSKLWVRHPEDWYVEEEWCNTRFFEVEPFEGRIEDPACGMGRIVRAARKAGHVAAGADIVRRGFPCKVADFFARTRPVPNIVCNPPFRSAWAFVSYALVLAEDKVAMLLPAGWQQGDNRSRWLERTPLVRVWSLCPRPSMPPGPVIAAGVKPGNGTTDYAWFVWQRGYEGHPQARWLRRQEKPTTREEAKPPITIT